MDASSYYGASGEGIGDIRGERRAAAHLVGHDAAARRPALRALRDLLGPREVRECPVPLTVRGTQALVSFAPLAFKLFYAARQNAVLRRSSF